LAAARVKAKGMVADASAAAVAKIAARMHISRAR
jgi:hypothetical protein